MHCKVCDSIVKGIIYGIRPTFVCATCCSSFTGAHSRHYNRRLVSVSRACNLYHLTAEDLKQLNYKREGNPVDDNGRPMRLFLGAEVEYLQREREQAIEREILIVCILNDVEERLAIENKKDQLEAELKVDLGELDAVERAYLLGDYLRKSNGTKSTLHDVRNRYNVLDQFRRIRSTIDKAHPGAIFDFCTAYPDGGPSDFADLQARCQKAFYSVGELIYAKLSDADRERVRSLALRDTMVRPGMSIQATIDYHLSTLRASDADCLLIASTGDNTKIMILHGERRCLKEDAYMCG